MRLMMLRHGQTPANVNGVLDTGAPGPGLTALGHRQAGAVPDALDEVPIDAIVVSSLVRTSLTAAPTVRARGAAEVVYDGIREIEAGSLEGGEDEASHLAYLETVFSWARGDLARRMPGGPDGHDFLGRYDAVLADIARQGWRNVLLVSHGAAIRTWAAARVAGVDVEHVVSTPLGNTGFVEVDGDPSAGWRLASWTAHPLGGAHLEQADADDPTGEAAER